MERNVKLTCETAGCVAENVPIEMITDATQYLCGACGQFITNAEEVTDGTDEEAK
jgi:predicted RNA-binding Zn-ribbon protein involved in translation (DUF1610 family)